MSGTHPLSKSLFRKPIIHILISQLDCEARKSYDLIRVPRGNKVEPGPTLGLFESNSFMNSFHEHCCLNLIDLTTGGFLCTTFATKSGTYAVYLIKSSLDLEYT